MLPIFPIADILLPVPGVDATQVLTHVIHTRAILMY